MTLDDLRHVGFDVAFMNHAQAILATDFSDPLRELCDILLDIEIPDVELIQGGGGEAKSTQRLRTALSGRGWHKRNVTIMKVVDGIERPANSHEIDHVRRSDNGAIALEIEWNNKDTFFDRDLDNFQRLHSEGVISVGIVVTRGVSMQDNMTQIVASCATNHDVRNFDDLEIFELTPTRRQRSLIQSSAGDFVDEWARRFVGDKFGSSTTHWNKLQERIKRGVGNPCPLLLIGIPASTVIQKILP